MNCKQVQELLPLYAGRDLEERRAKHITLHVQSCAECARVSGEYSETRQLLQELMPPLFSESAFAEMRHGVWREIEKESATPTFPQVVAGVFRPRLTWAVASAVLVAFAMFAMYFISLPQQMVGNPPTTRQERSDAAGKQRTAPSNANDGGKEQRVSRAQPHRRHYRNVADRPKALVVSGASSTTVEVLSQAENASEPSTASPHDSGKTLRMEMQTKDPNIRIIWFASVHPNSKGS